MESRTDVLIRELELSPHPEGGYYKEVYRSEMNVHLKEKSRDALTSIYFLLNKEEVSRWHKVSSDEVWIHLEGDILELAMYDELNGSSEIVRIGPKQTPANFQATVKQNIWQAARSLGEYSLVACVVAPGFVFDDFTMMEKFSPQALKWAALDENLKPYI